MSPRESSRRFVGRAIRIANGRRSPRRLTPAMARLPLHLGHVARAFGTVLTVAWFVFATIVIVLRYAVLPHVADYRTDFEQMAGRALGETVRIGTIDASWRGLRPALRLDGVTVVDRNGHETLRVPSARATLSWRSLLVMNMRLASLDIDGATLAVRRDASGQLFVAGAPVPREATPDHPAAEWLLAQDAIRIRTATIVWRDEMRPAADGQPAPAVAAPADLVLTDVDVALVHTVGRHRVALRATPPPALAAPVDLRAMIDHPFLARRLADPTMWRGELYADLASADIVAWRAWLPLPTTIDGGHGRARAWLRFERAGAPAGSFARRLAERTGRPIPAALDRISAVTADLALDDVAVRWGAIEYAALASIDGRVDASQDASKQRFSARHMALQPRDRNAVPPTDFVMERTVGAALADESGHATLGAIDIGVSLGLVPEPLVPPAVAEKLAALQPRGTLERMTVRWTGPIATPATFVVDAAFTRLSVAAQPPTAEAVRIASRDVVGPDGIPHKPHPPFGQPGFTNLAGTVTAKRTSAARPDDAPTTTVNAKIDSRGATVTAPGLFDEPILPVAHLAADVGVAAHGADLEVKVADGTVENPDLAGTVAFTFRRGPSSGGVGENGGRGWIDLDAHLSRADVARVPRYLPTLIAPKARAYLAKSLLSGRVTDATFRMHGPLARLDLRAMPGARAVPYTVPLGAALVAIRDTSVGKVVASPDRPVAGSGPDDAVFHAVVKVEGATFLYGPARDQSDAPAASSADGASTESPAASTQALPPIAWPAFEDVSADVIVDQARLTVLGRTARVRGYRLTDITAELPALADPAHVLRVTGRGNGPLQDLVRFVNASPVARWSRHTSDATQATGDTALALALDLPLSHVRDAEVAGSLRFADNTVVFNAATPTIAAVTGRVDFTDRGVAIAGLTARALGGPLHVDARTGDDGFIEVDVGGTVDVAALKAELKAEPVGGARSTASRVVARAADRLSGTARYDAAVRIRNKRAAGAGDEARAPPRAPAAAPDFVLQSDLAGLAIDLPAPLGKGADERWPLRIAVTRTAGPTGAAEREQIRLSLAERIGAEITRQADGDGRMAVSSAHYAVGSNPLPTGGSDQVPTGAASSLRIALPTLDVDAWRDVVRQFASAPRTEGPAVDAPAANAAAAAGPPAAPPPSPVSGLDRLLPERATLETPLLHAAGRDFTRVAIDAERLPSGWRGNVASEQVAGQLSYTDVSGTTTTHNGVAPASTGRLVARLSHLTIPKSETTGTHVDEALDASRRRDFPAIDLVADRFELRGRSLGRLEVVAANVGRGDAHEWQLEKLGLTMPEARFTATGAWGRAVSGENTRLTFDIEAADLGALMDRFGLTKTIRNGTARLTGNAGWNGGPATIDFASMEGSMRLEADKGQFLKADPGIAKLLNILSLQGLARRLTFDFNDVFAEGFAFDTVRADATVSHGVASTGDFTMRGVQATVSMSGTADLQHETTDLHVLVRPEINAGAASLGVAVVNPVLGLATFAAQYLFKDPISRALSFEYNVVGPWAKPEVSKLDRNGKVTPVVPKTAVADEPPAAPAR